GAAAGGVAAGAASGREKRRGRRRVLIGAATAAVLLLGGSGVAVAAAHKTIDVDVDGETTSMTTFAGSVDGLLDEAGIEIGPHDEVVLGADEALQDGNYVVVRMGEPITTVEEGEVDEDWTTGLTTGGALPHVDENGRDAAIEASRPGARVQRGVAETADGPVTIVADGEARTIGVHATVT